MVVLRHLLPPMGGRITALTPSACQTAYSVSSLVTSSPAVLPPAAVNLVNLLDKVDEDFEPVFGGATDEASTHTALSVCGGCTENRL